MGRKRKPTVTISPVAAGTEVAPADGLPPFRRFLDIDGKQRGKKLLIRLFFVTPNQQEISATEKERKSKTDTKMYVIAARMSWTASAKVSTPLFDYCQSIGFADDFSEDIVRLVINRLNGRHLGRNSLYQTESAMREFVRFLSTRNPRLRSITEIDKGTWIDYMEFRVKDRRKTSKTDFNQARAVFCSCAQTAFGGWLNELVLKEHKRRALPEHTSELAESTRDYSDVVMYQLLALFIFIFEQRIGFLKRYEQVTEADMPEDWIYPGRKKAFSTRVGKSVRARSLSDMTRLLEKWLRDEDDGYEIIINHCLVHHKLDFQKSLCPSFNWRTNQFLSFLKSYGTEYAENGLYKKFATEMGMRYGYDHERGALAFVDYYIKKNTADEPHIIMNQTGWCLANLLMMQTGVNREVVLTIPSLGENGESILKRGDTVFVKEGQSGATEVNLYGYKARAGMSPEKVIDIIVPKAGPLYQMLCDYERYVKVSTAGPFFEFNKSFTLSWSIAGGGRKYFSKKFPILNESGEQLETIECPRFRKVFASGALLDRMKNVHDMNELAELLRQDLNHGNFDTTVTNYLLKSDVARSVIDIAITTVINGKLEALKCRSRIETKEKTPYKKKVYLCHCVDPNNPSHDVAIADECRHYDMCLGCEQSVITKEHLPYICLRILQYEDERKKDPLIWPATWEDRWCIAHDALARYESRDKKNGAHLVAEAWQLARNGRVSLPPILSPSRI